MLTALLTLSYLLMPLPALGQLPDAQPPVVRFAPEQEVYPQNFSIAANDQGYVFLGSADGVLIFDGQDWQHVPLPNGEIVRWLETDKQGRVYVGGYNEFGYLEQAATGAFQFVPLSMLFADELQGRPFADIWSISASDQGVFFVALEDLFFYDPITSATRHWQSDFSFGPVADFQGRTWLQWRGEGLKWFDGESWQLDSDAGLDQDFLVELLPMGEAMIVVSNNGPWYRFDGESFEPLPEVEKIPYKGSMTDAFLAGPDTLGLTTQLGLLVFYELTSRSAQVVKVSDGFLPAAVKTNDSTVLAVDDLGFAALRWPVRWQVIGSDAGLTGTISTMHFHGESTFILTSSGVFATDAGQRVFQRLPWTDYEAWDLLYLPESDEYLFADSYEIKLISADGSIRVLDDDTTARKFVRSKFDADVVYVATEYGLQVLHRREGVWQSVAHKDDLSNLTVTHIIEVAPGELWSGSERGGIHQMTVEAGSWQITAKPVGGESGLEYGDPLEGAYLFQLGDDLIASTASGLFRYNGEQFEKTAIGDSERIEALGATLRFAKDDHSIWAFYFNRLFRLENDRWIEEDVSQLTRGALNVVDFHDHEVLVGGLGSIMTYDSRVPVQPRQPGKLKLTSVQVTTSGKQIEHRPLGNVQLHSADERLTLSYALSDYSQPDQVRYRTRLAPVETGFSAWQDSGYQAFLDLQPGQYLLLVEAMTGTGEITQLQVPVTVMPQWFESIWVRLLGLLLLLIVIVLVTRYLSLRKTQILIAENDLLEKKVTERTRALESANQQLEQMAHLDGLTQIPNRRKLDAYLDDVHQQCAERGRVMAVALIDLDHFKEFNDSFGHQAGDALLVELARLLSRNLRRAEDLVARYGGEEFLVVLPGADADSALQVIDGMRHHVEESDLNATISAGLYVRIPDDKTSVEDLIQRADEALYEAKNGGRNRVVLMY